MKRIVYCLLVAVMLSACVSNNSKKSSSNQDAVEQSVVEQIQIEWNEPKYSVGDIIMVGGEMGIVFAVTSDGEHGKVMSVSQTECSWYKAKTWCDRYGRGWELPRKDELLTIYRNKSAIDSALSANGYTTLEYCWCWSSDEYDDDSAWYVFMGNGSTGNFNKGGDVYVRAVSAF